MNEGPVARRGSGFVVGRAPGSENRKAHKGIRPDRHLAARHHSVTTQVLSARLWNVTGRDADEAACGRGAVAACRRHARAGLWELRRSAERRAVNAAARLERERNRLAAGDGHAGEPRVVDADLIEPKRVRSDLRAVLLRTRGLAGERAGGAARPLGAAGDRDARRCGLGRSGSRWCLRGLAATTRDGYRGSKRGKRISTCPHCGACYAKPVASSMGRRHHPCGGMAVVAGSRDAVHRQHALAAGLHDPQVAEEARRTRKETELPRHPDGVDPAVDAEPAAASSRAALPRPELCAAKRPRPADSCRARCRTAGRRRAIPRSRGRGRWYR